MFFKLLNGNKFYKIKNEYIKLKDIYHMKKLEITNAEYGRADDTKLIGCINGREYIEYEIIKHYKPEYQEEKLKENEFYKEYSDLYRAFLKFNGINF